MLLPTSTAGAAWMDLAAFIVLLVLFELLAGLVMGAVVGPSDGLSDRAIDAQVRRSMLLPGLAIRALASIAIIAALLRYRRQSRGSVGLGRGGLGLNLLIGIGSTVVVYGLILLSLPCLHALWPAFSELAEENVERIMKMLPRLQPLGFVALAVMIGIYEELVFRGFLMIRLRRAVGNWTVAVLISTALFTALHAFDQTGPILIWIAILSLVFSVVVIWRRSLVPAIVGHALFDASQFLLLYFQAGDAWT
jgi:membrane protease YdiL (CAAX protease family)